ncbi:MAG: dTMP kinase [Burkholderiales bacterium]|nr:dTMP kinase [Pseudomonadota bacterium]MDA1012482.1 dTMP kinase [Pseudomonadota bacterium]
MTKGLFITFEGVDGAGKSTQLDYAVNYLRDRKTDLVQTREPGGTPLSEQLRDMILGATTPLDSDTEVLLMFAARKEHIARVIKPALDSGALVICDRFTDATFAYQGGGSGVDPSRIEILEHWVQGTLQPDLTLFFDLPIEIAQLRMSHRAKDRFESEAIDFHERVRQAYLDRAKKDPARVKVIDSSKSKNQIRLLVQNELDQICS